MRNLLKSKFFSFLFILSAIVLVSSFSCSQRKSPPGDLVLLNGYIYTVNPDNPTAKALVITGNKITAVCKKDREAEKYIGEETRVIDLEGKFVTPGIVEIHDIAVPAQTQRFIELQKRGELTCPGLAEARSFQRRAGFLNNEYLSKRQSRPTP